MSVPIMMYMGRLVASWSGRWSHEIITNNGQEPALPSGEAMGQKRRRDIGPVPVPTGTPAHQVDLA